jgi:hypothetical protein
VLHRETRPASLEPLSALGLARSIPRPRERNGSYYLIYSVLFKLCDAYAVKLTNPSWTL